MKREATARVSELYYGFIGVALAWQGGILAHRFLHRPLPAFMILAVLAKASFGIAVLVLHFQNRVPGMVLGFQHRRPTPGSALLLRVAQAASNLPACILTS